MILASIGVLVMVWPSPSRYRATSYVRVGPPTGVPTSTLTIDADAVARPHGMTRLIEAVRTEPLLAVAVRSVAGSQMAADSRVRDATALVQATANAVAPTRSDSEAQARANGLIAAGALNEARGRLADADAALAKWKAAHGADDPAVRLAALDQAIQDALTRRDAAAIAQLQTQRAAVAPLVPQYAQLNASRAADTVDVVRATEAYNRNRDRLVGPNEANAEVKVTSISDDTLPASRPILRLGAGALLLIAAIVAADVLFVTRRRLRSPYADETARDRHRRRKAERRARRGERASGRSVSAVPLDMPNLALKMRNDAGGGLRPVELRDAADGDGSQSA